VPHRIGEEEPDVILVQPRYVVNIAADEARRPEEHRGLDAAPRRERLGEELPLHTGGEQQLIVELVHLRRRFAVDRLSHAERLLERPHRGLSVAERLQQNRQSLRRSVRRPEHEPVEVHVLQGLGRARDEHDPRHQSLLQTIKQPERVRAGLTRAQRNNAGIPDHQPIFLPGAGQGVGDGHRFKLQSSRRFSGPRSGDLLKAAG
jgi:hypothetical protein